MERKLRWALCTVQQKAKIFTLLFRDIARRYRESFTRRYPAAIRKGNSRHKHVAGPEKFSNDPTSPLQGILSAAQMRSQIVEREARTRANDTQWLDENTSNTKVQQNHLF